MRVALCDVSVCESAAVAVLCEASGDAALSMTSLPRVSGDAAAREWLRRTDWRLFVITVDGVAAGLAGWHEPDLTDTPDGYDGFVEPEVWVAPAFRRSGVTSRAWVLLRQRAGGVPLVGEVWVGNEPSARLAENLDGQYVGTFHWSDGVDGGAAGDVLRYVWH